MNGWSLEDCARRPGAKKAKCVVCKNGFNLNPKTGWAGVKVAVREFQVSNFRGDDDVEFAHPGCLARKVAP